MPFRSTIWILAIVLAVPGRSASAQAVDTDELELLDQTVADISDLSASLRSLEVGLGHPTGFDRVYRVPGDETHQAHGPDRMRDRFAKPRNRQPVELAVHDAGSFPEAVALGRRGTGST